MEQQPEEREDYWYFPGLDGRITVPLAVRATGKDMHELEASAISQLREFVGDSKPVITKIERGMAQSELQSSFGHTRDAISFEQDWTFYVYAPMKGVADGRDFPSGEDD